MSKPEQATALSEAKPARSVSRSSQSLRHVPMEQMDATDREFLPSALEILDSPPSPIRVASIWFIATAVASALAWSWFGRLEIHAVAQGRVQPSGRSKIVQPLDTGRIMSIHVENGQSVQEGALLLTLDPTETTADRTALELELQSSQAEGLRRRVALDLAATQTKAVHKIVFPEHIRRNIAAREQLVLEAEMAQLTSTRQSLEAQYDEKIASRDRLIAAIGAREKIVALARERASMREALQDRGSLSRAMVIEVMQQYESQLAQLLTERGQLVEVEALLKTLGRRLEEALAQFIAEQTQKLLEAERRISKTEQELIKADARQKRSQIRAPIGGIIQQISVTTVGQVVAGGQPLLTIVPHDTPLEVEALVLNKDIGFVREGQRVVVKIEAFPFTRYGLIEGQIRKISREAIDLIEAQSQGDPKILTQIQGPSAATASQRYRNLVFAISISLSRQSLTIEGAVVPLTPGMSVTAEISTGSRRVLDFVLSPLVELASTAGHER